MLEHPQVARVAGDWAAGFYRRVHDAPQVAADHARERAEAYSWGGLTAGAGTRALWLLLVPFMLANMAFFALPAQRDSRRDKIIEAVVRLFALSVTVTFMLVPIQVAMDLVGWQCIRPGVRNCTAETSWLRFLDWTGLDTPGRRVALMALVPLLVVGLLAGLGRSTWLLDVVAAGAAFRDEPSLPGLAGGVQGLFTGQLVLLFAAGAMLFWITRSRDADSPAWGGLASAALMMLALTFVGEIAAGTGIRVADWLGTPTIEYFDDTAFLVPGGYFSAAAATAGLVPVLLVTAGVGWWWLSRRATAIEPTLCGLYDEDVIRADPGRRAAIARLWARAEVGEVAQRLLGGLLVLAAVVLATGLAAFWPRAAHPLAPPCYTERTVPDLITRIGHLGAGGRVLLSCHSQGSVIGAAVVMQLAYHESASVGLLTYGNPIRRLYCRFFPRYFSVEVLHRTGSFLLGSTGAPLDQRPWRNLHRRSDPIGGPLLATHPPGDDRGQLDRQLVDPGFARPAGDTCYPAACGHSNYFADPAFAAAAREVRSLRETFPSVRPPQGESGVPC